MFELTEAQRKQLLQYMWTRPYGEVVKLMNSLSTLIPVNLDGGKHDGKK